MRDREVLYGGGARGFGKTELVAQIERDELRAALRDIRVLLLDGLDYDPLDDAYHHRPPKNHLREIAKVMTRPTIARFTRGA